MKKTYILDTNVLLSDSNSLFGFEEHDLVLPLIVLEELDRHKDRQDEVGRNAREVVRKLADLTKVNKDFKTGIPLGKNLGTLKILSIEDIFPDHVPHKLPMEMETKKSGDNTIAQFCVNYIEKHTEAQIVLVTRDTILRLKAQALGIACEDYRKFNVATSVNSLYSGVRTIEREDVVVADFYKNDEQFFLPADIQEELYPNQFVVLKNGQQSAMARFYAKDEPVIPIGEIKSKLQPRNKEQEFARELLFDENVKLVTLAGKSGCGKAQPLNAKILTPHGWTTMGKIQKGDYVVGKNGKPTKVTGVFPQGVKPIYEVVFSDGSSTQCCDDHLWFTQTVSNRTAKNVGTVKSLKEIRNDLKLKDGRNKHYIPMVESVEFESKEVPLDPYLLGLLIGDGGFSNHTVTFTSSDEQLVNEMTARLPETCTVSKKTHRTYDYLIHDKRNLLEKYNDSKRYVLRSPSGEKVMLGSTVLFCQKHNISPSGLAKLLNGTFKQIKGWTVITGLKTKTELKNKVVLGLESLGLQGHKSYDKFIPDVYKYNNSKIRLEVLQGLMDTDGTVSKNGYGVSFSSSSETLAKDVQELVWSFGGKAVISEKQTSYTYKGVKKQGRPSFVVQISVPPNVQLFKLNRKIERQKVRSKYIPTRSIESINPINLQEAQCISVEDQEHLYVTDDYIVTHNTLLAIDAGLEQVLNARRYRSLVICRPVMPVGKDIGFLPGDLNEKLEPWLAPIKDNLRFLLGASEPPKESSGGSRKKKIAEPTAKFDEQVLQSYFDEGIIEVQAMTFIRGRSIANAYIIVDEAQNTNLHEIKTILTRVGENTKIVLTGDLEQIDSTYVDSVSNGLSIAIERFKSQKISGHVTFLKGERSLLATIASEILI
jgi:predicted ribonuclease YlaK